MHPFKFFYSAMNGGKTTTLIQTAYNYTEVGKKPLVIKSSIDTKADRKIVSRTGMEREVDIVLNENDSLLSDENFRKICDSDVILIDEVQFLSEQQIDELWRLSLDVLPVITYGLKSDFSGNLFPASKKLFVLAECKELDNIPLCFCGNKATFNARKVNNQFTVVGKQNVIDGEPNIEYVPMCGKHYSKTVLNQKTLTKAENKR